MGEVLILDTEGLEHKYEFEIYEQQNIPYTWVQNAEQLQEVIRLKANKIVAIVSQVNFKVDGALIEYFPNLKAICTFGMGFNNVDVEAAALRQIPVCNVPDYSTTEVADHTVALALACSRNIKQYNNQVNDGHWVSTLSTPIRRFNQMTFGLIGFGKIAQEVAKRVAPFGFRVIAHDKYVSAKKFNELKVTPVSLEELLDQSNIISLHVPLTNETANIINKDTISKMTQRPIMINTSRGGTINEEDLLEGINNGQITAAGLDVLQQEPVAQDHILNNHPRIIITPHVAYLSIEAVQELQVKTAQNICRVLQGDIPHYIVNNVAVAK